MNSREEIRIIKQSVNKTSIQKTKGYIESQLNRDGLKDLTLQMGPNCNLSCFHCYGHYGPNREGLPKEEMVSKLVKEAVDIGLERLCLTDGEPFRYENKKIIRLIAKYSKNLPVNIITNGSFAKTRDNAINWLNFLREEGFDLSKKENNLEVSCGIMYKVPHGNYLRIHEALKEVFPHVDFGNHFRYRAVFIPNELELGLKSVKKIVLGLEMDFYAKKSFMRKDRKGELSFFVYPKKGSPIKVRFIRCRPVGRAKGLKCFDSSFPVKDLSVKDLGFFPDLSEGLWVGYDGKVSFGHSGQCIKKGKFYGNVNNENLGAIKSRIQGDSLYNAFKLGGARFVYYLAQKINSKFNIVGRTRCDVCNTFFENNNLVDLVRERLDKKGVAKSYIDFIEEVDFRKPKYI